MNLINLSETERRHETTDDVLLQGPSEGLDAGSLTEMMDKFLLCILDSFSSWSSVSQVQRLQLYGLLLAWLLPPGGLET